MPASQVTVLSGILDSHHNQFFLFNFFERLRDQGVLNWRTVLYEDCRSEDLDDRNLVVFSRPRYPEVFELIDRCRARGVPTLVLIDDNWIAAGREFPRQCEALFTPGKPPFEAFLHALRQADAVLVTSPPLEEDVRPLARRVLRLPPNVDLARFAAPRSRPEGELLVGFAGSLRMDTVGFRGLSRFLARRPEVRLLVMGHQVPRELEGVPAERLTFLPWQHDYDGYARTLASLRPDVLVAPLDASRTAASKIPTKYLEAAAVGAAGVYSRLAPYTDFVRDGETGLLVDNREEDWEEALDRLADDPALRRAIAERSLAEVRERFDTERVLPRFVEVLREITKR
jgi:glycosyltransferase involved in cell wall biosynthesis